MNSSAPRRRLDVHAPERRRGSRTSRPGRFVPSPAFAGAIVLMVAGVTAVGVSPKLDTEAIRASYETIDASNANLDSDAISDTKVDQEFDQGQTKKQVEEQSDQVQKAITADTEKVQKRADEQELDQWVLPVTGYQLTARFGESSGLWSNDHTGLDFAGPSGSTIVSVTAGTVTSTGQDGAYGNRTVIEHDDGTQIWYAHQSKIAVSKGDSVSPGDKIGYTGSTGNVTGPHLHLEVHPEGGDAVDPEKELASHNVKP